MTDEEVFKLQHVSKEYKMGQVSVRALQSITCNIEDGEMVVILGPSGSGKSTLLNIMGGMDAPTHGQVYFQNINISTYSAKELTLYRREKIGFVFQFYNLMPNLTARENIELATELVSNPLDLDEILAKVDLKDRADHFPSQMSGGEQQRVAIARAIAKNPVVLLCDEPTGALDYSTGIKVLTLLQEINREMNKTVVIITHNQPIAQMADRIIKLGSGKIVEIIDNKQPLDPSQIRW